LSACHGFGADAISSLSFEASSLDGSYLNSDFGAGVAGLPFYELCLLARDMPLPFWLMAPLLCAF